MLGIPLGLAYVNAGEWLFHRFVLHGIGKWKAGPFAFHYHEHHRAARRHQGYDPDYKRSLWGWHPQSQEALGLALTGLVHLPLIPVAPFFAGTVLWSLVRYHRVHKRAHLDPEWARQHLPWHYDHHMGPDQEANWCVTQPWFDNLMGTRRHYVGTARETADRARRDLATARP
jgi:hypothetical protein